MIFSFNLYCSLPGYFDFDHFDFDFTDAAVQCHKSLSQKWPLLGKWLVIKTIREETFARYSFLSFINYPTLCVCIKVYKTLTLFYKIWVLPSIPLVVHISGEWPIYQAIKLLLNPEAYRSRNSRTHLRGKATVRKPLILIIGVFSPGTTKCGVKIELLSIT